MKHTVALAIVAGIVGGILTWLYEGPLGALGLFVPATFMGAAMYFAAGGDLAALKKSVPASIWGVALGTVALIIAGLVSGPAAIGLVVGVMTVLVILGGLIPGLGFIPGLVVAFAMTVGWGLLTEASGTDFAVKTGPFTVLLLSFVIGGLYGWVGSIIVGRIVSPRGSKAAEEPVAA